MNYNKTINYLTRPPNPTRPATGNYESFAKGLTLCSDIRHVTRWAHLIIARMVLLRWRVYPRDQSQIVAANVAANHLCTRLRHCTELDEYGIVHIVSHFI